MYQSKTDDLNNYMKISNKMTISYQEYIIEIIDDPNYTLNSSDNTKLYQFEYFDEKAYTDRVYPTSKHGIRVKVAENEIASAIICEIGGATAIHTNSLALVENNLLICCCDKVYSLKIPELTINWKHRFDPATCFAIYPFQNDFIIHGELQITRIDYFGNEKWNFGGRDIFVTSNGKKSIDLMEDKIKLIDWQGYIYSVNEDGKEINLTDQ